MILASILLAACLPIRTCTPTITTNCATPTPVLAWDEVTSDVLAGYRVYSRTGGDALKLTSTLPCEWADLDEDGVFESRNCRGSSFGVPVQRFDLVQPGVLYEFSIKAYDLFNQESPLFSNPIEVCCPPIYNIGSHGPYD